MENQGKRGVVGNKVTSGKAGKAIQENVKAIPKGEWRNILVHPLQIRGNLMLYRIARELKTPGLSTKLEVQRSIAASSLTR